MSEHKKLCASEKYRLRAEECRANAKSFRDERTRTEMLSLAADYLRKAAEAEIIERWEPGPATAKLAARR